LWSTNGRLARLPFVFFFALRTHFMRTRASVILLVNRSARTPYNIASEEYASREVRSAGHLSFVHGPGGQLRNQPYYEGGG